ncbi:MAG: hypothetical protein U0271_08445 [Polyangiaceae bacterium]
MRRMRARALLATPLSLAFALALGGGCDAELDTGCRDGTCEPDPTPPAACGEPFTCQFEDSGDLPCDVYCVLDDSCHKCHVPGGIGPFPLLTYDNTQRIIGDKPIWKRMQAAVQDDDVGVKMPQDKHPMAAYKIEILNKWFETCDAGHCVRRSEQEGTGGVPNTGGGGAGGDGGNGGTGGAPAGGGGAGGI